MKHIKASANGAPAAGVSGVCECQANQGVEPTTSHNKQDKHFL